ncbi:hypothetical protein [Streptomyces cacaoi]|nr:hypothetical protein [Streptomyces cacaoi]
MRRRRNKDGVEVIESPSGGRRNDALGESDSSWHPIAQQLYEAYAASPQSYHFEPSDWAQLRYVITAVDAGLTRQEDRIAADTAHALIQALEDFLTTEAVRRRVRIAVEPGPTTWPEPQDYWHPVATTWFTSLSKSGQSTYYQQTDIAFAVLVAEMMHRHLMAGRNMGGKMLLAVTKACALLLTTEASRRVAQMELAKVEDNDMEDAISALMREYAEAVR